MKEDKVNRRNFLKIGAAGAAAGAIAIPGKIRGKMTEKITENVDDLITIHDDFPAEIRSDYKPHSSKDNMFIGAPYHPEDLEANRIHNRGDEDQEAEEERRQKKGYGRLADALNGGAWALHDRITPMSCFAVSNHGAFSWDQSRERDPYDENMDEGDSNRGDEPEEGRGMREGDGPDDQQGMHEEEREERERDEGRYEFASREEASNVIKRAAIIYGASLVGITRRDKRWDYSEFVEAKAIMQERLDESTYGWERFPFEPKTVIVMAFEEDYEAISTAPSGISGVAVGQGYSQMSKVAYQLSVFLKELGYKSVAAGNDMGLSIPYAIAAGLGEGSRMSLLVTYKYGPRVRIAKVYTDLDFVEYDKPVTFGVMKFCKNCRRCADACPTQALTSQKEPSFEPLEGENRWFNAKGIKKYWIEARKCQEGWSHFGSDCGACVAACPYNKPDFWHHRLIDKINAHLPGPVHDAMREMDKIFGYGEIDNPDRIDKFFDPRGRSYNGH